MSSEADFPRIIVRLRGHGYYYPVSDVLRLFTGSIPKEEDGYVVCDAGALSSCPAVSSSASKALVLVSSVSDDWLETYEVQPPEGCSAESEEYEEKDVWLFMDKADCTLAPNREVKRQLYFVLSRISGKEKAALRENHHGVACFQRAHDAKGRGHIR